MTEHATLSIALVSGKGGVGKTNLALNLAYALHRAKQRVLLMDCDIGLANLDVLLGIAPKVSIEQVMTGEAAFEDAVVNLESSFSLLPAASGIDAMKDVAAALRSSFLRQLNAAVRPYDYLLLDVGAGITDTVQTFASKSAMRVVVVTPEPTSITDAYALIKVIKTHHNVTEFHVLVNQAVSPTEEKTTFTRLAAACNKFLGISPLSLGGVRFDQTMHQAVRRQEPLLKFAPTSPAGKDLIAVAARIHKLRDSLTSNPEEPLKVDDHQARAALNAHT